MTKEDLINSYLSIVRQIANKAKRHCPPYLEFEDLFQQGVLGLIEAIDNFDPSRSDFHKCICMSIKASIYKILIEHGLIKIPRTSYYKQRKETDQVQIPVFSLNYSAHPNYERKKEYTLLDFIEDRKQIEAFLGIERKLDAEKLLKILSKKEQEIVKLHFGIDTESNQSIQKFRIYKRRQTKKRSKNFFYTRVYKAVKKIRQSIS